MSVTRSEAKRLIIDTDIGVDDAVAILLALCSSAARVEAITTVTGNVAVDQCVRNARYVLELGGYQAPIYRGAARPLAGGPHRGASIHGSDGLGDLGLRPLRRHPDTGGAAERLAKLALANPGALTLVTLGPLTNLALAMRLAPELVSAFREVVVMGGTASGPGTTTPRAEFNIWCDPTAAKEVLAAGLPITMVPIDISRGRSALSRADQAGLAAAGTAIGRFAAQMLGVAVARGQSGMPTDVAGLPDVTAMAIALESSLVVRSGRYHVDVETRGALTRGETVIDYLRLTGQTPNVELVEEIDADRYKALLRDAFS